MSSRADLVEIVAMAIYCDGTFRQYDPLGADPTRWARTSETQRRFCRDQAAAALDAIERAGYSLSPPQA